ncbi:MAG: WYL domain-containing protein [Victivallaceae bacterium]|nr:WYL domain-containing protein [Victivallaceae bacterium]
MAGGFSSIVALRLWDILSMIADGLTRSEMIDKLQTNRRNFSADISRLKKLGLELKYSRIHQNYTTYWPGNIINVKFSPREFFYILYCLKNISEENPELNAVAEKLELLLSNETDPVYDCGPAYGIEQNITADIADILTVLKRAISKQFKLVFFYKSQSSNHEIRIVHPYKLIHTPISWYLVGYCEDREDFRNFKLARMSQIKILSDHYHPRQFQLKKHLGDAFWLRHDPSRIANPHLIKILFKGDAADAIKEYKFHSSQTIEETPAGTVVAWRLSYLGEFASWLLQWLGTFEIIENDELKLVIKQRLTIND